MSHPPRLRSRARLLVAPVLGLAAVPFLLVSAGTPAQADDVTHEASYSCQYSGVEQVVPTAIEGLPLLSGLPVPVPVPELPSLGGRDTVGVEVTVKTPAQVAPGAALPLSGTATFTFGPNATATNASTVFDFLSDSFGITVGNDGISRFLRITELTTSRSTVASPVVTARWELPDYLVPSTATGRLTLSLPSGPLVTNPVSTSPASVAFTGILRTDSRVQPERAVACALEAGEKAVLGTVRVAGAPVEEPPTETPSPDAPSVDTPALPTTDVPPAPGVPDAPPPATVPESPTAPALGPVTLAAEPIPPATVADGVRLPPWALLFGGVFVAGGVMSAVSTSRRMRGLAPTGVAAGAVITLVALAAPLATSPRAEAAVPTSSRVAAGTGQAQVTLLCVYEPQGSTSNEVPKSQPTGLSISLNVPDSVAPGEVVTLTGSASVQAPEDIRSQGAALGYNQLDAISDTFSVGLTIGSANRQVFLADRWQTGKTAFSNPLVVRGPLYFPGFQVPADATGSVDLELPRNEVLDRRPPPNSNPDTPKRVAVEFLASASGNGTSITYVVSCWRNDQGAGRIASIPIRSASDPGAPEEAPTSAATTAPSGVATTPAAPGATTPGAVAPPGATTPPGTTPAPGAPATVAPGAPALQGALTPTATTTQPASQDVVIPTWALVAGFLLALLGYGYAGWNHLRMRSARQRAEG